MKLAFERYPCGVDGFYDTAYRVVEAFFMGI
jgi:hypothetical protein